MIKKDRLPAHYFADHYRREIVRLSELHGRYFDEFTHGFEHLTTIGDRLLMAEQATGYNFILSQDTMNLASKNQLSFIHTRLLPLGILLNWLKYSLKLLPLIRRI